MLIFITLAIMIMKIHTVYHESFEVEKFHGFRDILHVHDMKFRMALFKYGFKRKYVGFRKSFCKGLHVQLATKLSCLGVQ